MLANSYAFSTDQSISWRKTITLSSIGSVKAIGGTIEYPLSFASCMHSLKCFIVNPQFNLHQRKGYCIFSVGHTLPIFSAKHLLHTGIQLIGLNKENSSMYSICPRYLPHDRHSRPMFFVS